MLDADVGKLRGVGQKRRERLEAAGIRTFGDLLMCFPRGYRDFTTITPVRALKPGVDQAFSGRIAGEPQARQVRGLWILSAIVEDDGARIHCTWFGQLWLKNRLVAGSRWLFYGSPSFRGGALTVTSAAVEPLSAPRDLQPLYPPLEGIGQATRRAWALEALGAAHGCWEDDLPEALRERHGLAAREWAIARLHLPRNMNDVARARRRLAFEDALKFQIAIRVLKGTGPALGVRLECDPARTAGFEAALPFALTGAQARVRDEIRDDLRAQKPMARLVQGDVGCGKTVLAFYALFAAVQDGYQGAMMAPTEILARQHFAAARELLEPLGVRVGLLTGSLPISQRNRVREALRAGEIDVVLGTQALITADVAYANLGVVVTDEQHRFGVRQRTNLAKKGDAPNLLVMSATPIPRTLALVLYGDLEVSIVDELPPGRKPVTTRIVPEEKRHAMWGFVREQVRAGRQGYVVCPLVEDGEAMEAASAQAELELVQKLLPDVRADWVHGRMRPAEKEAAMARFMNRETDLLVSTTVIEVGVNVPNATVMIIENAERFGLAQLHQLRGRVGRGGDQAWCFLLSDARERLQILTQTGDGFQIAQRDLENRGPGELLGTRQSGTLDENMAAWVSDLEMLKDAQSEAQRIMEAQDDASRALVRRASAQFSERFADLGFH